MDKKLYAIVFGTVTCVAVFIVVFVYCFYICWWHNRASNAAIHQEHGQILEMQNLSRELDPDLEDAGDSNERIDRPNISRDNDEEITKYEA